MSEKIKILLVEDDPLMARLYQRAFSLRGYEAELAANGLEGVEKAKTFQPALILLDVMMPKMNGLQALEKLKSDEVTKKIPIFMLTNLVNEPDAKSALSHGAAKYLVKSDHDTDEIVRMVQEYLAAAQSS